MSGTPDAWRLAVRTLECAAEGFLSIVANPSGDYADAEIGRRQQILCDMHPPPGEVPDRRPVEDFAESVSSPSAPWRITGICRQGGICKMVDIETRPASRTPPMRCWSPYGSTMTSTRRAQCLSPWSTATQQAPLATTWNKMMRSESGRRIFAVSRAVSDSYAHGSRYSARRNTAPSSRSRSSADWSAAADRRWSRAVTRSDAPVSRSWPSAEPPIRLIVS